MTLLILPFLNVGFSVIKRSLTSTGISQGASGRETRVSYWTYPMWEWDLTYEYLPDDYGGWVAGKTSSDIKTLMGMYGEVGVLKPFLFIDPDDFAVASQPIGTGDGTTTSFTLIRTYGAGGTGTSEPIGYVLTAEPFNVYLGGVLQTSGYTLDQTLTCHQLLTFSTPPASGVAITVDVQYAYLVRFKDNSLEFEKIFNRLWSIKKVTLISLKDQISA